MQLLFSSKLWTSTWRERERMWVKQSLYSQHKLTSFWPLTGDLLTYFSNAVQPLSSESHPTGRSGSQRHHTYLAKGSVVEIAFEGVRPTNSLRYGQCWKDGPATIVEVWWRTKFVQNFVSRGKSESLTNWRLCSVYLDLLSDAYWKVGLVRRPSEAYF